MNMMYWAIFALVAFVAIWMLLVAPAERRHHARKLEMLQKRIDAREGGKAEESDDAESRQGES